MENKMFNSASKASNLVLENLAGIFYQAGGSKNIPMSIGTMRKVLRGENSEWWTKERINAQLLALKLRGFIELGMDSTQPPLEIMDDEEKAAAIDEGMLVQMSDGRTVLFSTFWVIPYEAATAQSGAYPITAIAA